MTIEAGRLVIEPGARKKYSLQKLLALNDASAHFSGENRVGTSLVAAGRELFRCGVAIFI